MYFFYKLQNQYVNEKFAFNVIAECNAVFLVQDAVPMNFNVLLVDAYKVIYDAISKGIVMTAQMKSTVQLNHHQRYQKPHIHLYTQHVLLPLVLGVSSHARREMNVIHMLHSVMVTLIATIYPMKQIVVSISLVF